MSSHSDIEWTDATWNPIAGCSLVSPGCTNCYAMKRVAPRLANNPATPHYAGTVKPSAVGPVWTGKMGLAADSVFTKPLRWKEPKRIFVNSTSDLFHEDVPDAVIDRIFAVMALTPQHTYQVLTKRSARMRDYMEKACGRVADTITSLRRERGDRDLVLVPLQHVRPGAAWWPLPNVWLGVSCEDQRRVDERVPDLLATPAAIRFVSAEPLLGSIDLSRWLWPVHGWWKGPYNSYAEAKAAGAECGLKRQSLVGAWCTFLDWIIVGGESGNGARPMHPDWARQIRDQCAAAGTAFFFKQWGEWEAAVDREVADPDWRLDYRNDYGDQGKTRWLNLAGGRGFHGERFHVMRHVGKHRAGRLLDGVEHNAMPTRGTVTL